MEDISVSIVTHGTKPEELKRAIECILKSNRIHSIDVLDNSGSNLPAIYIEMLEETISTGKVHIRIIENRGYGAGHNLSIKKSIETGQKYHLVMNADVWWDNDILTSLCQVMDSRPDIGHIMPKVYYPDGCLQLTSRRLPTPFDVFAKRFLPDFLTRKRIRRYLLTEADHDREINSPYLLGSFMLFRVDALKDCGLFDERFFMYPEDIDITRRLHRKYKTLHYPLESIVHEHNAASRKNLRMMWIHITNMIRYFNKWGWFYDPERRRMNKQLESGIIRLNKRNIPESRG